MRAIVRRAPGRGVVAGLACVAAASAIAGCGSSDPSSASRDPQTLLRQTFSRSHAVRSGVLDVSLQIVPHGSSVLTTPLSLSLDGPFQSRGSGQTPDSALTVAFSGAGHHGSFGVRTTAGAGYVSLEGVDYRLPAADDARLHSFLGGGSAGSAPGLSTLGSDPQQWIADPRIVGTQTVAGVVTEHVHATVDVAAFLASLNRVLARERSTLRAAAGRSASISPAEIRSIASRATGTSVDVYTGRADTTLRRFDVTATVPVPGTLTTRLGGLTSATFSLSLAYAQLNRPRTIAAPTDVHSDAQLQAAVRALGAQLQSGLDGGAGGGS